MSKIGSESELAELLEEASREMGFAYFALTHHVDFLHARAPAIRLASYPPEWIAYFDGHELGASDPVHRASHFTSVGFAWSSLPQLIKLTPQDRHVLALAAKRGIGDGFTIPAHVPGESNGSCSFATRSGTAVDRRQLPLAQLVGAFAFEAARRLWHMSDGEPQPPPRLTDRQRDCVLWVARGKTDWEVSRILGLSPETVTEYVKRARDRFGASTRAALVARTLFDGAISFADIMMR